MVLRWNGCLCGMFCGVLRCIGCLCGLFCGVLWCIGSHWFPCLRCLSLLWSCSYFFFSINFICVYDVCLCSVLWCVRSLVCEGCLRSKKRERESIVHNIIS